MNKEIKKEWLKALRSGAYKQGKDALHKNGRFCCLGVLYDACLGDEWVYDKNLGEWGYVDGLRLETAGLSSDMCRRISLNPDVAGCLAELNDTGSTFTELADYIEKNL